MKTSIQRFIALFLFGLGLFSTTPATYAQDTNTIVSANTQFAFDLYSIYKSKDGNIFFSPFSISSALAMTYEGAAGQTKEEMQSVLHFPKDPSSTRKEFQKLFDIINNPNKDYALNTANALWIEQDYSLLTDYLTTIKTYYGGNATSLNFKTDAETSRLTINTWVEDKTKDKIKNLIPQGLINADTRLVLTNAIYFKSEWLKTFDKENTQKETFYIDQNKPQEVDMMHIEGRYGYAETASYQALEMPYKGREVSLIVILPKDAALDKVERELNAQTLTTIMSQLTHETVIVSFPKLKFEAKYMMANDLKKMGMPTAFGFNADFSKMTDEKEKLTIDEVIHQSFVAIDEQGTEAAAATAVIMREMAMAPTRQEQKKVFKANHPFIFMIVDNESDTILFLGRLKDPTKS